jgi:hypothetical protein
VKICGPLDPAAPSPKVTGFDFNQNSISQETLHVAIRIENQYEGKLPKGSAEIVEDAFNSLPREHTEGLSAFVWFHLFQTRESK